MSHHTTLATRSVYTAEDALEWALQTSATHGSVVINGVPLTLEPEARYASLESIQAYVDRVLAHPGVIAEFGPPRPVRVRERKTGHAAHYAAGVIAINTTGSRWAMRETTVLHELAHHFSTGGHGPAFAAAEIRLLELVMGPQAALALRILFDQNDVPVS